MKQLEVVIMGQSYTLSCPDEDDARLLEAVEHVDATMCKIKKSGKVHARERIAVLAAVNLAFELFVQDDINHADVVVNGLDASSSHSAKLDALLKRLDDALDG